MERYSEGEESDWASYFSGEDSRSSKKEDSDSDSMLSNCDYYESSWDDNGFLFYDGESEEALSTDQQPHILRTDISSLLVEETEMEARIGTLKTLLPIAKETPSEGVLDAAIVYIEFLKTYAEAMSLLLVVASPK